MSLRALEIIDGPDADFRGAWHFHKNHVALGGPAADVPLPGTTTACLWVEVHVDHVLATPDPALAFWRLNGKRATLPKRLRAGDEFEVQGTCLRLVEATFRPVEGKKALLERRLRERKASGDPVLDLIKHLTALTR